MAISLRKNICQLQGTVGQAGAVSAMEVGEGLGKVTWEQRSEGVGRAGDSRQRSECG